MALQACKYFAPILLLLSLHGARPQNDAAEPETIIPYEMDKPFQNEAADDKLCLARNAIAASRQLAERFNDGATLSREDFSRLLTDIQTGLPDYGSVAFIKGCSEAANAVLEINGEAVNCSEVLAECPSIDAIHARHSEKDGGMNYSQLAVALQEAALSLTNPKCLVSHELHKGYKPTTGQAWGYGIGFVTLVCIISNIGGLLTPFMSKIFFQRLLQFLVAMGAGTLAATGLLVLIPEAFDIVSIEALGEEYIWKSATALFSIYIFFISERFLKFFLQSRNSKPIKINQSMKISTTETDDSESDAKDPMTSLGNSQSEHGHSHFVTANTDGIRKKGPVATVAWMVLIGDVMHNFVDGMAIGAAFTENVYLGVSIGIAVLCEELPHELGDVAILLHSGMSMKRALFLNFLSACVCYLGLIIGIVLGENTAANRWILAVAGGLFLYVPLVDMLPDMSEHLDQKMREGNRKEVRHTFLSQAVGLLLGFLIILCVVVYVGEIEV